MHENLVVTKSYENNEYIGYECESTLNSTHCKIFNKEITKIKDRKTVYPLTGIINNKPTITRLNKKLFYCDKCNTSTIEKPIKIEPHAQKTNEIINLIRNELKENVTYSAVARRYKLSISNVINQFDEYRNKIKSNNYHNIRKMAIDEVKFIPKAGNYQLVVVNHDNGSIVDILENRFGNQVKKYLQTNLPHIELVTQDFWQPYKTAVKAVNPNAVIVSDTFHLARFALWGFDRTRVSLQKQTGIKLGKHWKPNQNQDIN